MAHDKKRVPLMTERASRLAERGPILSGLDKVSAVLTKVGEVGFIASFPADGVQGVGLWSLQFAHKLVPGLLQKALHADAPGRSPMLLASCSLVMH